MEQKGTEIPQIKEEKIPPNCPVPSPCPVCPSKPKPTQILLKILLVLLLAIILTFVILVGSGLRIVRKESLLDVLLASRRSITPTAEVAQPTPDPTAGWKTHTNLVGKFMVKYPDDWTTKEVGPLKPVTQYISNTVISESSNKAQIAISVSDTASAKKLAEGEQESGGEKFTLDGITAIKWLESKEKRAQGYAVGIKEDYVYGFLLECTSQECFESNKQYYLDTFNRILSTFKFLDQSATSSSTTSTVVPKDWKEFVTEDWDQTLKVTLSMPPGFSFKFTGSEWTIQNDSDATELWDFSPRTDYDGSSRRKWYQEKYPGLKILSVEEINLNQNSSYLKFLVEISKYNDHGEINGTQVVNHYLFIKDNIANIITPVSNKAYSSEAVIPKYISSIFASLKLSKK